MLSDEEKKEYIEHEILDRLYCLEENDFDKNKVNDGYIKAVLNACKEAKNLIEKQSKEIEELKETLKCTQNSWYEDTQKIEEMKKQIDLDNECEIALNSKVMDLEKEIEELKEKCKEVICIPEGTCFMLEPKDVDKKWKDKIKAKIEEVKDGTYDAKIVLQSLLKKE